MVPRLSFWLYWPTRLFAELMVVCLALAAITQVERAGTFSFYGLADILRLHLMFALPVFWLARWRPWTIWIMIPIWCLALLALMIMSAAMFMGAPPYLFAFGLIVFAAYRLGKSQHRKRVQ